MTLLEERFTDPTSLRSVTFDDDLISNDPLTITRSHGIPIALPHKESEQIPTSITQPLSILSSSADPRRSVRGMNALTRYRCFCGSDRVTRRCTRTPRAGKIVKELFHVLLGTDLVLSEYDFKSSVYPRCILCHHLHSRHDIGCTEDKHNFKLKPSNKSSVVGERRGNGEARH